MTQEIALGYICDALKRLERAIEADAPVDREMYLEEARLIRQKVEHSLIATKVMSEDIGS